MQYVTIPLAASEVFFVQSADARDMQTRITERLAAQAAAPVNKNLAGLELGGGSDGHTFSVSLTFVPAGIIRSVFGVSVFVYLAADAANLPPPPAAAPR